MACSVGRARVATQRCSAAVAPLATCSAPDASKQKNHVAAPHAGPASSHRRGCATTRPDRRKRIDSSRTVHVLVLLRFRSRGVESEMVPDAAMPANFVSEGRSNERKQKDVSRKIPVCSRQSDQASGDLQASKVRRQGTDMVAEGRPVERRGFW
ncbi:hypothetical protein HDK90DRAFT_19916 [Phyllosticta capitalensis]|uniref:Uncharacterized protein n=1 Tax=Phyllosticta capitalensis TaxID=121624 RepID=A0ABR1Z2Z4_9PEZI